MPACVFPNPMGQCLQGVRLLMKALLQLKALTRIVLVLVCGGADLRWGSGVCDCARAGVCQHSSVAFTVTPAVYWLLCKF
mgnify:CR=1 FL=1